MANLVKLTAKDDVPRGQARVFTVNDKRIALCHVDGEFYAIDDVCTHDAGPLGEGELDGYAIECPRHGARFDVRSGKVLALPAPRPVPTYQVKIEGDDILVMLVD